MRLLVTAIALSAALVAGCTHSDVIVGGGPIVTGADGVRTFTPVSSINGNQAVCTLASFDQDSVVRGRVASDPTRSVDSVWLRSPQGDDLHVVWPGAWSFAFEAEGVVISDAQGQSIASEGDEIVLAGHPVDEAAGSQADPYIASGWIDNRCYPYIR